MAESACQIRELKHGRDRQLCEDVMLGKESPSHMVGGEYAQRLTLDMWDTLRFPERLPSPKDLKRKLSEGRTDG